MAGIKVNGSENKKDARTWVIAALAICLAMNALAAIPFAISGELRTGAPIGLALRITGLAVSAIWLLVIILGRVLRTETALKGLFFYGVLGFAVFAVALAAKLVGGPEAGEAVGIAFDWFSFILRPLAYILQPLIGMSEFYAKAIIFGLLTASTGIAARSILRERDFQKKMAEKREFEEQSKKST